jgi:antirestriction protein ArdC
MDWYIVVKTINGRRYRYRQKTWRESGRVRTRSEYLGRADAYQAIDSPTHPAPPSVHDVPQSLVDRIFETLRSGANSDWDHQYDVAHAGVLPSQVNHDARADAIIAALGVSMTHRIDGAYFTPKSDEVNVPPEECFFATDRQSAGQAYYMVVFHEIVHWTKTHRRLGRRGARAYGSDIYAREELVAELGAAILVEHLGIGIGDEARHSDYFQSWHQRTRDREESLQYAKHEAARAVRYILKRGLIRQ